MKLFEILLFIAYLFVFINSTCETDEEDTVKYRKYDDCKNRAFNTEETEYNAYRCCHLKVETETANVERTGHGCKAVSQSEYNNIKKYVSDLESQSDIKKVKIDCESSHLIYGLYCLLLFLL